MCQKNLTSREEMGKLCIISSKPGSDRYWAEQYEILVSEYLKLSVEGENTRMSISFVSNFVFCSCLNILI